MNTDENTYSKNYRDLDEKEECVLILQARIREIRHLENLCKQLGIVVDEKRIANKIGGLMKVINYIQNM